MLWSVVLAAERVVSLFPSRRHSLVCRAGSLPECAACTLRGRIAVGYMEDRNARWYAARSDHPKKCVVIRPRRPSCI